MLGLHFATLHQSKIKGCGSLSQVRKRRSKEEETLACVLELLDKSLSPNLPVRLRLSQEQGSQRDTRKANRLQYSRRELCENAS